MFCAEYIDSRWYSRDWISFATESERTTIGHSFITHAIVHTARREISATPDILSSTIHGKLSMHKASTHVENDTGGSRELYILQVVCCKCTRPGREVCGVLFSRSNTLHSEFVPIIVDCCSFTRCVFSLEFECIIFLPAARTKLNVDV